MRTLICENCGKEAPRGSNNQKYCSWECNREKFKETHPNYQNDLLRRLRRENPEKYRAYDKRMRANRKKYNVSYRAKYDKEYPERLSANKAVVHAVRNGKLEKPDTCEKCGVEDRIVGHHEDYSKKLEVMWLCGRCHSEVHSISLVKGEL